MEAPQNKPLPVQSLDYAKPVEPKLWKVGTLVYTSGGLAALFFWLLWGDFALSMRDRSVGPVFTIVLKSLKTSNLTLSLFTSTLPAVIGMILAPIISYKSDCHRGRWGRRIPFLLIPTPIAALSMIGLAISPRLAGWLDAALGDHSPGLTTTKLICLGTFWTLFDFAAVIAGAVLGGLINDVVPREVLGRFFGLFRACSLIAGMIFNGFIIGYAEWYYHWIFIGMAILFGVGFTMMCFKVKEGQYPPVSAMGSDHRSKGYINMLIAYARECLSQPYYLLLYIAFVVGGLAAGPVNMFTIPYYMQLQMSTATYGKLLLITYAFSLLLAYPLGSLVDRFHSIRISIIAMALYALTVLIGYFMIRGSVSFGVALVLHGVLSGTFFTASAPLAQTLYPKLKFGQFAAAGGLLGSIVNIVTPPIIGQFLDATGSNYRLTYLLGGIFGLAATGLFCTVYVIFMRRGGPKGYTAPDARNQSHNCRVAAVFCAALAAIMLTGTVSLWNLSSNQRAQVTAWNVERAKMWKESRIRNIDALEARKAADPAVARADLELQAKHDALKKSIVNDWKDKRLHPLWSVMSQSTLFCAPEAIESGWVFSFAVGELAAVLLAVWVFAQASRLPSSPAGPLVPAVAGH